jgi:hypothetical protein
VLEWGVVPSSCHCGNLISPCIIFVEDARDVYVPAVFPKLYTFRFRWRSFGWVTSLLYRSDFPRYGFG